MARCTLEIDLAKIRANYQILCQTCNNDFSNKVEVGAAIKADSYGLGMDKIVPVLYQEGCNNFFTTSLEEGINASTILRNSKANVFVLDGVSYKEVGEFIHYGLIPVLNHLEQIKIWQEASLTHNLKLTASIHLDTGLNRFGIPAREIEQLINNPSLLEGINLHSIISHLSAGMEPNNPYNLEQLKKFQHYLQYFPKIKASLANSSALFLGKEYYFDLVRPGGAIYGVTVNKPGIVHQTFRLTAPIIQLHEVPKNNSIGYNMTFTTNRPTLVAVVSVGYADGYLRAFSNKGEVFISNYKAPVIGRVSMDLITIDVTDIPPDKIFLGAEVEIIGENLTADKMASLINSSSYEILATITKSNRYKKIYKDYVYN